MEIPCEFKYGSASKYTCAIADTEFCSEDYILVGQHYSEKSDSDVLELNIRDCKFKSIPVKIFEKFPNIEALYITESDLTNLAFDDVKIMKKLTKIELRGNEIRKPDASLLKLPNLKSLCYFEDRIISISRDFIKAVRTSKLTHLHIPCYTNKFELTFDENFMGDIKQFSEQLKFKMYWDEIVAVPDACKHISQGLEQLYKTKDFYDFIIKVGSREFKVHRAILSVHSSVFAAMFKTNMEESLKGEVTIIDFNAKTVEEFLEFIYIGKVSESEDTDWMSLLEISGKYDVQLLKKYCECQLVADLDSENAYDILVLANIYDCPFMKMKAFQQIKENFEGMELTDYLMHDPEKLKEVVTLPVKKKRKCAE
jgi:hypothetical protein